MVQGYVPTVTNDSQIKQSKVEDSIDKAEKQKLEKNRTRIEMYEKRLPMRKLTIADWVKAVQGGDESETTTTPKQVLSTLHVMKDASFWKTENILD